MNVLLINPSTGYYTRALFNPLGLISIGSHLKRIGHNVRIVDRCIENVNISALMDEFKPGIVGVSLMSSRALKDAVRVSKIAKKKGICVAWGGAMPSIQPDICLKENFVDYVMISEGEFTFEELIEAVEGKRDKSSVLALAYRDENGDFVRTGDRPFADLRDMPITDFSLFHPEKYMQEYLGCEKMMYLYSSKGCPCSCAFCSNTVFHRCTHRKRPNEYVIEEIKYLIENYNLDGVYFTDELWVTKKSDAVDFCRRVKENNLHFRFGIQARIGQFEEEDFKMLYDAGCRWIIFGIETGSRTMMKRINKQINYDKIIPTFEICKRIGLITIASFIIGYPDESVEELKETTKLLNTIGASLAPVYHFTPLPGTKLYDEVVASGIYKAETSLKELSKSVATEKIGENLSRVPSRDLRVIRCRYDWKYFTKPDAFEKVKPFGFAIQTIKNGLNAITRKGILFFLIDGFRAFKEFSYVFFYAHAFPKIRKKYDLYR